MARSKATTLKDDNQKLEIGFLSRKSSRVGWLRASRRYSAQAYQGLEKRY
jgi:hypothetical protein